MINVIFIGDICGRIGRQAVIKLLPRLKKKYKADLIFANAENSAHGSGITDRIFSELTTAGIDCLTMGDHAFGRGKNLEVYENEKIIRPANWSPKAPGQGFTLIPFKQNKKETYILLVNLIGRIFMKNDHECPFNEINAILANESLLLNSVSAIMVDIHAETTAEKINMLHHLDGRVSAVLGTHTHVQTADEKISKKGTAFITDIGMAGAADESLGIAKEGTLKSFLTQIPQPHVIPEKGLALVNAVCIQIDEKTKRAKSLERIVEYLTISN